MIPSNTLPPLSKGSMRPPATAADVTDKRYAFDVGPLDFARILHPKGGTGQVAFGGPVPTKKVNAKGKPMHAWADRRWSPHAIATRAVNITGARFITMATYRYHQRGELKPGKTEANIVAIGSNWIDLDSYGHADWKDVPPETIREVVLNTCEDLGLPAPSFMNGSGQGNLVVWQYPTQPWSLIGPRWKAVQQTLHQKFLFLGSDRSGRTPTKWYRLPRTRNEKNGMPVTLAWPHLVSEIRQTTFDILAAAVLPHARQSKAERDAAKAARAAKPRKARAPRTEQVGGKLGGRSYWETLRTDLDRVFALRHGSGPVPDGAGRNAWIVAFAYAAAWDMKATELAGYVEEQAARCGLEPAEALAKTVSIRKRAMEAATGVKTVWNGRKVDPRYRPKPATFVDDLGITPAEMRKANTRMLVDDKRRRANAIERAVKSRRNSGVGSRAAAQDTRLAVGRAALDMREQGLTNSEVCLVFDVTPRYLDTALRDARAVAAIGKVSKPTKAAKAKPVAASPAVPEPAPEPIVTPDAVALAQADCPAHPAHEALRGTRENESAIVIDLVAGSHDAHSVDVTTVGTYLLSDGRPPCAIRPGGRLLEWWLV